MSTPSQTRRRSFSNLIPELQLMIIDYLELQDKASLIEGGTLPAELIIRTERFDAYEQHVDTILHAAIQQGYERATECLLRAGVPASLKNDRTMSSDNCPLLLASSLGNLAIVRMLLDYGASVHEWEWSGIYPLHYAAEHGHAQVVQLLLDKGAEQVNNFDVGAPIHLAAAKGHAAVVRILIAHGGDPSSKRRGVTALWLAVYSGDLECVRALLEGGANVKPDAMNYDWVCPPPLHLAAGGGRRINAIADTLIDMNSGKTCRFPATTWLPGQKETYAEMVRLLLASGADITQELDSVTAIELAAVAGNCSAVDVLTKAGGYAHPRTAGGRKNRALIYARVLNHEDIVQLLLKARLEWPQEEKPAIPPKPSSVSKTSHIH